MRLGIQNPKSTIQNPKSALQNRAATRDAATILNRPVAFVVDYADGLRATALILNGHVDDTTVAVRLKDADSGRDTIVSTLMYLPAPPGARFLDPLVLRIEDFFKTGKAPYPVERTLLTGGILAPPSTAACNTTSPSPPPNWPPSTYTAPADSGFIRAPLTEPTPNRLGHYRCEIVLYVFAPKGQRHESPGQRPGD